MAIVRTKSEQLFEAAKTMFPGGVHSPVRAFKSVDGAPLFIERGDGCYLYDVDANRYTDFCCSWGPLILGHNHPEVRKAVVETVQKGASFGAPSALGNRLGQFILERHRFIEKIRFVSSGTEAVMSALRLARGITGRSKILKFEGCYHGHVDALLVKAGSGLATFGVSTSAGVPETVAQDTCVVPLNDFDHFESTLIRHGDELAAVIIEPIPANNGLLLQQLAFLEKVRQLCTQHNVLLIFDEVISGFRVGFEGAAGYYGIQPDIITFGKILGGGMPVGAYAARHEIMNHVAPEGTVYQAGTLSANPVTMAAGLATLEVLVRDELYDDLARKTQMFAEGINTFCQQHQLACQVESVGSIFWINFSNATVRRSDQIFPKSTGWFRILHQVLLEEGIYLGPSAYEVGFISAAHTPEVLEHARTVICKALLEVMRHETAVL